MLLPLLFLAADLHLGGVTAPEAGPGVEQQTRAVLAKIETRLRAEGLTLDHLVYTTLHLTDIRDYEAVNKIYGAAFPGLKPARATVGVVGFTEPGSKVMISGVAIRELTRKKPVRRGGGTSGIPISDAVLVGDDTLYLSGTLGRDADTGAIAADPRDQIRTSLERARGVLALAGFEPGHLVQLSVYHTARITPAMIEEVLRERFPALRAAVTRIEVRELALGTNFGITGIAAR